MTVFIVSGTPPCVEAWRETYHAHDCGMDIDVSDYVACDPSDEMGFLPGSDPRVFPAMVKRNPAIVEGVTALVSTVKNHALAEGSTFAVSVQDDEGTVVAPAIAGVIAGYLNHCGIDVELTHLSLEVGVASSLNL